MKLTFTFPNNVLTLDLSWKETKILRVRSCTTWLFQGPTPASSTQHHFIAINNPLTLSQFNRYTRLNYYYQRSLADFMQLNF